MDGAERDSERATRSEAERAVAAAVETLTGRGLAPTAAPDATITLLAVPPAADARKRSLGPASIELDALPPLSVEPAAALPSSPPAALDVTQDVAAIEVDGGGPVPAELCVLGVLGEGGMGRVELARQRSLRREVAIKRALPGRGAVAAQALLREALYTGYLEHPNIVPVHQLGRLGEAPVLVMKRVDGVSWRALIECAEHPHWAHRPGERLVAHVEILMQVCHAVHFAHSRGIVHRDIKPENVMVGAFGEVYLMDWGIALDLDSAEATSAALVGTPAYLAPEMLDGARGVGPTTDVYLLGACLYEVLAGRPPHLGESVREALVRAFRAQPGELPEGAPEELVALVRRCMARSPAERPPSALALREALGDFLRHRGSSALAEHALERFEQARVLDALDVSDEAQARRVTALLAEARFGLQQALRAWPDNAAARRGLQRCLEATIERELAARNRGLAAALYEELPEPVPRLAAGLEALSAELESAARSREALVRMEHEHDVRVAARQRARFTLVFGTLVGAMATIYSVLHAMGLVELRTGQAAITASILALVLVAALWAQRRSLMQTRVNRQLGGAFVVLAGAIVLSRVCLWQVGASFAALVISDLVLLACFVSVAALIDARLKWLVPAALAGPLLASQLPDFALAIEGAVMFLTAFDIAWFWRGQSRGA